ncbi:hypothetical protein B0T14DRAFT_529565 [Immersiella caudata]|uniref:Ecp2 effector protein-like domain-containing protein n=1 Tax=Immersiella caudata TaxID=314043 RepID=A0AA39WCR4_9PEZI|nr:hypothetical protein B0T14DRAFT_529565 [Immersiella caudata]
MNVLTLLLTLASFALALAAPINVNTNPNPTALAVQKLTKRNNECGASTFENKTSGGSPTVADYQKLADNIKGTGTWLIRPEQGQRKIAELVHPFAVSLLSSPSPPRSFFPLLLSTAADRGVGTGTEHVRSASSR